MLNDLIFFDDFVELYIKLHQRGLRFILSKFTYKRDKRTISSFSDHFEHANWWVIPYLKLHRNYLISGDPHIEYEQYVTQKYFGDTNNKRLVSFGCGAGSHEILFAKLNPDLKVEGYDISKSLIETAQNKAKSASLHNTYFETRSIYNIELEENSIDYLLFNASLHHFKDINNLVTKTLFPALKRDGLFIINEYVGPNRLIFPASQIDFCNICLNEIPLAFRKILKLNRFKTRCYRAGKLRMILSDPSECVDSESIIPVLRSKFREIEFVELGGNILAPTLKHIAHHFIDKEEGIIKDLINKEKKYLESNSSDFVFAIYQKP